jgi:hypothetical protein
MCEKLKAAGNVCELFTVEGGPHGMASWPPAYKARLIEWLKEQLK